MSITQKGIGMLLIFVAMATAITLLAMQGCASGNDLPEAAPLLPQPSWETARYRLPVEARDSSVEIVEFRTSTNRACVLAHGSNGRSALSCSEPILLAPLDYENLPEIVLPSRPAL